jgi:hypothetical protein
VEANPSSALEVEAAAGAAVPLPRFDRHVRRCGDDEAEGHVLGRPPTGREHDAGRGDGHRDARQDGDRPEEAAIADAP